MNTNALCPDCGGEFDTTEPVAHLPGIIVFKCPECGHLIYQLEWDEDTWGEFIEEE